MSAAPEAPGSAGDGRCSSVSMGARIEQAILEVAAIEQRYLLIRAFHDELSASTLRKEFAIRNQAVWTLLLDTRDMLVVHLASWCRAAYGNGGLFGQLKGLHLADLRRKKRVKAHDNTPAGRAERGLDAAYERRFPGVAHVKLQPADVDKLKDWFVATVERVVDDRDNNRGHPWEKSNKASVVMLELDDLATVFTAIGQLLDDLYLIATRNQLRGPAPVAGVSAADAAELVDVLLFGSYAAYEARLGDRGRAEFYEDLHRGHDGASGEHLFNELAGDVSSCRGER